MAKSLAIALAVAVAVVRAGGADQLPNLRATTLSGTDITLPGETGVAAYILSVGFSHKCDKAMSAWDKRIAATYSTDSRVRYYELPVIQGLLGFVKPLVYYRMRRAVPKPEQSRFAPLYEGEEELKRIVGFSAPNVAYLVVATGSGRVVWTTYEAASDSAFAELRKAVSEALR